MKRHDRPDPPQGLIDLGDGIYRHGMRSGRPLDRVRAGWLIPLSGCERAHWFDPTSDAGVRRLRRLCDGELVAPGDALEPGNWRSCRRCRTIIQAAARSGRA